MVNNNQTDSAGMKAYIESASNLALESLKEGDDVERIRKALSEFECSNSLESARYRFLKTLYGATVNQAAADAVSFAIDSIKDAVPSITEFANGLLGFFNSNKSVEKFQEATTGEISGRIAELFKSSNGIKTKLIADEIFKNKTFRDILSEDAIKNREEVYEAALIAVLLKTFDSRDAHSKQMLKDGTINIDPHYMRFLCDEDLSDIASKSTKNDDGGATIDAKYRKSMRKYIDKSDGFANAMILLLSLDGDKEVKSPSEDKDILAKIARNTKGKEGEFLEKLIDHSLKIYGKFPHKAFDLLCGSSFNINAALNYGSLKHRHAEIMHEAAKACAPQTVKRLIEKENGCGIDVDIEMDGKTPLICAIDSGNTSVAIMLIDCHADMYADKRCCPLFLASEKGCVDVLRRLIIEDGNIVNDAGRSLLAAARNGNNDCLKALIENGCAKYINKIDEPTGMSSLHYAASNNDANMVNYLISSGADINAIADNYYGDTPLTIAAGYGFEVIVNILVNKGAIIDSTDVNGNTPLMISASNGHDNIVDYLLKNMASVKEQNKDGDCALTISAFWGYSEIIEKLISYNASIDVMDGDGNTPLLIAATQDREDAVDLLARKGANVNATDQDGRTAIHLAAMHGNSKIIRCLVKKANIKIKDACGKMPHEVAKNVECKTLLLGKYPNKHEMKRINNNSISLTAAAEDGDIECVKRIIENGNYVAGVQYAKIENSLSSALLAASSNGHNDCVKILIDSGAHIESCDQYGRTSIMLASKNGHSKVIKTILEKHNNIDQKGSAFLYAVDYGHADAVSILIDSGARIDITDCNDRTPINCAAYNGHVDIVRLLLDRGADTEVKSAAGWTPLHDAASRGHKDTIKLLIEYGADIEATDRESRTPIHFASKTSIDSVFALIENGANITAKDGRGLTPLHYASANGGVDIIKALIQNGANVDDVDVCGYTALMYATIHGHLECAMFLLNCGANANAKTLEGNSALWFTCNKSSNERSSNLNVDVKNKLQEALVLSGANVDAIRNITKDYRRLLGYENNAILKCKNNTPGLISESKSSNDLELSARTPFGEIFSAKTPVSQNEDIIRSAGKSVDNNYLLEIT